MKTETWVNNSHVNSVIISRLSDVPWHYYYPHKTRAKYSDCSAQIRRSETCSAVCLSLDLLNCYSSHVYMQLLPTHASPRCSTFPKWVSFTNFLRRLSSRKGIRAIVLHRNSTEVKHFGRRPLAFVECQLPRLPEGSCQRKPWSSNWGRGLADDDVTNRTSGILRTTWS